MTNKASATPLVETTMERLPDIQPVQLTAEGQQWLSSFGVDPSWSQDPDEITRLNNLIDLGSRRLRDQASGEERQVVLGARAEFIDFMNAPEKTIEKFLNHNIGLPPTDTVIGACQLLNQYSINVAKVINAHPAALGLAPESVEAKVENLESLGLNAAKVINAYPTALGYAPKSVEAKVENLESLGLNAAKVIDAYPTALGYAPKSVEAKVENLESLGLNAAKVINASPTTLGFAPESVEAKVENLESLGLNATKVINAFPAALDLAPKSVRAKVALIDRAAKLLGWQHSANEIIEQFPVILSYNSQKLSILRRLSAEYINSDSMSTDTKKVKSALIRPLEQYILAADDIINNGDNTSQKPTSLDKLVKAANRNKMPSAERKERALAVAKTGRLGRIGVMYLEYRGEDIENIEAMFNGQEVNPTT